jgi:flagellar protein FliO/FliZ
MRARLAWRVLAASAPAVAAANAAPAGATPAAQGPGIGDLVQMALSLVLVIGFILALTWVLGRMRGLTRQSSGSLSVLAEVSVGPKERVVLVRVGESQALIGVGASGLVSLELLATPVRVEVTGLQGTFAEKLKGLMTRTEGRS